MSIYRQNEKCLFYKDKKLELSVYRKSKSVCKLNKFLTMFSMIDRNEKEGKKNDG